MQIVLVANPKGGSGKSTLAANLAGYFASRNAAVMLGDLDRQQSLREWLQLRPATVPWIASWELGKDAVARPPKGTTHAVLDTPAGLHGKQLGRVLERADKLLIPVQPSLFDRSALRHFIATLLEEKAVRKGRVELGLVGMRVDPRTRGAQELDKCFAELDLPVLGCLRDTQLYPQTLASGLTLFDLAPSRIERDRREWQPILDWLAAPAAA
jgi:chromosome partitioning protein